MDTPASISCPVCRRPLAIRASGAVPVEAVASADVFMTLPYRVSSTARWVCGEHGDMGRVVVAVVDDHVEFVTFLPRET